MAGKPGLWGLALLLAALAAPAFGTRIQGRNWPATLSVDYNVFDFADGDPLGEGWRPVRFEIQNQGSRPHALTIELDNDYWDPDFRAREEVLIEPGTTRRIWLYYWGGDYQSAEGKVRGDGFEGAFSGQSRGGSSSPRVFVFTDSREMEKALTFHIDLSHCLFLPPTDIPPDWRGLSGVDKVVLYDLAVDHLSLDQRNALESWLKLGGELILVPSANGLLFQSAWIQELLDLQGIPQKVVLGRMPATTRRFSISGYTLVGLPAFQPLIGGNDVRYEVGEAEGLTEVVIERGAGRLKLECIPFNAEAWQDQEYARGEMFENLLLYGRSNLKADVSLQTIEQLKHALKLTSPPSWLLTVPLLAIYVFCPLLLYFHYRRKREEFRLLWGLPLTAVCFALLIFMMGYLNQGWQSSYRMLSVVELPAGGGRLGLEQRHLGVFSARVGTFDIALGDASFARIYPEPGSFQTPAPVDAQGRLRGVPLGLWEMLYCGGQELRELGAGVDVLQEGGTVRILNRTPGTIHGGLLVSGLLAVPVDAIPSQHEVVLTAEQLMGGQSAFELQQVLDTWSGEQPWLQEVLRAWRFHPVQNRKVEQALLILACDDFESPSFDPELSGESVTWLKIPLRAP